MKDQAELGRISNEITSLALAGGSTEELELLIQESMEVMKRIKSARQKRFGEVLDLVRDAIEIQDPNAYACEITNKIVKLFES